MNNNWFTLQPKTCNECLKEKMNFDFYPRKKICKDCGKEKTRVKNKKPNGFRKHDLQMFTKAHRYI